MLRFESQLSPVLFSGSSLNRGPGQPSKGGAQTTATGSVFSHRPLEITLKIETSLDVQKREVKSHYPGPLALARGVRVCEFMEVSKPL